MQTVLAIHTRHILQDKTNQNLTTLSMLVNVLSKSRNDGTDQRFKMSPLHIRQESILSKGMYKMQISLKGKFLTHRNKEQDVNMRR